MRNRGSNDGNDFALNAAEAEEEVKRWSELNSISNTSGLKKSMTNNIATPSSSSVTAAAAGGIYSENNFQPTGQTARTAALLQNGMFEQQQQNSEAIGIPCSEEAIHQKLQSIRNLLGIRSQNIQADDDEYMNYPVNQIKTQSTQGNAHNNMIIDSEFTKYKLSSENDLADTFGKDVMSGINNPTNNNLHGTFDQQIQSQLQQMPRNSSYFSQKMQQQQSHLQQAMINTEDELLDEQKIDTNRFLNEYMDNFDENFDVPFSKDTDMATAPKGIIVPGGAMPASSANVNRVFQNKESFSNKNSQNMAQQQQAIGRKLAGNNEEQKKQLIDLTKENHARMTINSSATIRSEAISTTNPFFRENFMGGNDRNSRSFSSHSLAQEHRELLAQNTPGGQNQRSKLQSTQPSQVEQQQQHLKQLEMQQQQSFKLQSQRNQEYPQEQEDSQEFFVKPNSAYSGISHEDRASFSRITLPEKQTNYSLLHSSNPNYSSILQNPNRISGESFSIKNVHGQMKSPAEKKAGLLASGQLQRTSSFQRMADDDGEATEEAEEIEHGSKFERDSFQKYSKQQQQLQSSNRNVVDQHNELNDEDIVVQQQLSNQQQHQQYLSNSGDSSTVTRQQQQQYYSQQQQQQLMVQQQSMYSPHNEVSNNRSLGNSYEKNSKLRAAERTIEELKARNKLLQQENVRISEQKEELQNRLEKREAEKRKLEIRLGEVEEKEEWKSEELKLKLKRRLEIALEENTENSKSQVEQLERELSDVRLDLASKSNSERLLKQKLSSLSTEMQIQEDTFRQEIAFLHREIEDMRCSRDIFRGASNETEQRTRFIELETELHLVRGHCQTLVDEKTKLQNELESIEAAVTANSERQLASIFDAHAHEVATLSFVIQSLKTDALNYMSNQGHSSNANIIDVEQLLLEKNQMVDENFKLKEELRFLQIKTRSHTFMDSKVEALIAERRFNAITQAMLHWKNSFFSVSKGLLAEGSRIRSENEKLKVSLLAASKKYLAEAQSTIQQLAVKFQEDNQARNQAYKELQNKYVNAQSKLAEMRAKAKDTINSTISHANHLNNNYSISHAATARNSSLNSMSYRPASAKSITSKIPPSSTKASKK